MSLMTDKKLELVIDCETTGKDPHLADLLGWSWVQDGSINYEPYDKTDPDFNGQCFPNTSIIGHNAKYDAIVLRKYGWNYKIAHDTMIAFFLLHIDKLKKLEEAYFYYFKKRKKDLIQLFSEANPQFKGKRKKLPEHWWEDVRTEKGKIKHYGIKPEVLEIYAKADAQATYMIYQKQAEELSKLPELKKWFYDIEMPLCNILVESEIKGVKINTKYLQSLLDEFTIKQKALTKTLKFLAGEPNINLNSSAQLRPILFKKLGLREIKETDGGEVSTDKFVLEELAKEHAFPKLLLELRQYEKLVNTFISPLLEKADSKGRIHASFNQCGTVTRRFSCSNPNLQQIPAKGVLGKRLRQAFVADAGKLLLCADYSQIELRLLAHFSKDKNLINIFNSDLDIHAASAAGLYNVKESEVTKDQRDVAKIFNFSILYGKTSYGLAQTLHITETEAQALIDSWFAKFPSVKEFMEDTVATAIKNGGWLKSLAGLPLYVDNVRANNRWERESAYRQAVNYPIQSSSQDIIKKAIVDVYEKKNVFPVLMVHDELVYEVEQNFNSSLPHMIPQIMESAFKLDVPLKVNSIVSNEWSKE